ncbi:MAG TPA: hypothetical protein VHT26_14415 [Trebonia sp.]|nr:hypothetical protein [Trebonia sp.]
MNAVTLALLKRVMALDSVTLKTPGRLAYVRFAGDDDTWYEASLPGLLDVYAR